MANNTVQQYRVSKDTLDLFWNKHTHGFLPIPHHFLLLSKQISTTLWSLKEDD